MDKIICLGKNYREHAKELGDQIPEKPVLFLKPPSSLVQGEADRVVPVRLPQARGSVHHECEIVLRLDARGFVDAYTLGLDMTLRDLQSSLKKAGHPWEVSKVFEGSAIVGEWLPFESNLALEALQFELRINQQIKQKGASSQMMLPISECVNYARDFFPLCSGDLIFTGTPAGVGPVKANDHAELLMGAQRLLQVKWS
jgi:2-keto-4-pentenoate hydratase/2-oxohepta-3-ene-1,7-dioic acid hydratase in catechol pathway